MLNRIILLMIYVQILSSFSYSQGTKITFPWKVKKKLTINHKFAVPTHQIGFGGEIGGNLKYSNFCGSVNVSLNLPYIFINTFEFDPYFGLSALFPPVTEYTIDDYPANYTIDPDDKRIRRFMYGLGFYLRPLAFRFSTNHKWTFLFLGSRIIWLEGFGQTQDALDSVHSSNIYENYTIKPNIYFTVGFNLGVLFLKFESRITNNKGKYSSSAYDPYGIGPSYGFLKGPFNEPKYILTLGLFGLLSFDKL